MGYNKAPKAAVWLPRDTQFGDLSVDEIRAKHAANQEAPNKANMATWDSSPTLTSNQIAILDGVKGGNHEGKRWDSVERDGIGQPKALARRVPPGYKSAEPDQTEPSDSEPRTLRSDAPTPSPTKR